MIICVLVLVAGLLNYCIRKYLSKRESHPLSGKYEMLSVDVAGNQVCYVRKGKGKNLILVHGSQMNAYDWRDNIDTLSQQYCVYALDMLGCGWSDKPQGTYSPQFYAKFLLDFMDAMQIDKASFVGSSWGGGHVLEFALKYPKRVDKLVLASPCCYKHQFNVMDILRIPLVGRLTLLFTSKALIRGQLKSAYYKKEYVDAALVKAVYIPFFSNKFIQATLQAYKNADFGYVESHLSELTCKTCVVWGEKDGLHPIWMAEQMKKDNEAVELVIFPDSGHLLHSENSEEFNKVVLEFLR